MGKSGAREKRTSENYNRCIHFRCSPINFSSILNERQSVSANTDSAQCDDKYLHALCFGNLSISQAAQRHANRSVHFDVNGGSHRTYTRQLSIRCKCSIQPTDTFFIHFHFAMRVASLSFLNHIQSINRFNQFGFSKIFAEISLSFVFRIQLWMRTRAGIYCSHNASASCSMLTRSNLHFACGNIRSHRVNGQVSTVELRHSDVDQWPMRIQRVTTWWRLDSIKSKRKNKCRLPP